MSPHSAEAAGRRRRPGLPPSDRRRAEADSAGRLRWCSGPELGPGGRLGPGDARPAPAVRLVTTVVPIDSGFTAGIHRAAAS
jgi:hypothetical protein